MKKVVYDIHLLAEAMALRGHNVYALYYESMWQRNGRRTPKEMVASRALPNSVVHLICPSFVRIPVLSRASAFVSHFFEIKRIIKEKRIDVIVLYSVPTNGLQAVHWAKRFNIPIVFRSIDALNRLVPYPILRPVTRFFERLVYSRVDRVSALTPKLCDYAVGLGAKRENVGVLPMTVDTNRFRPLEKSKELMKKWGLSETDKVILFMGTLFNFSGLDSFIRELSWRIKYSPDVKLLIVGDGEQRQQLESAIRDWGLEKSIIITGFQPYQDMSQYINLADVCVNTFVRNDVTKDIFPGKTVQFLACGKPLVMRPLDGVKALIEDEERGVVYAEDDIGMADKVFRLLKLSDERRKIGENGLRYAREFHSHEKVAKQLEAELDALIKGRRNA